MNDEQLLRYSRHILLDEIGVEGQERIAASHALVIGEKACGGCEVISSHAPVVAYSTP